MDENTLPRGAHPPQQQQEGSSDDLPNTNANTNNESHDPTSALTSSTAHLSLNSHPSSPPSTNPNPISIPIPTRSFPNSLAEDATSHSDMEDLGLHPVRTSVDEGGDVLMQLPSIRGASGMQALDLEQGLLTPRNTAGPFVFDGSS